MLWRMEFRFVYHNAWIIIFFIKTYSASLIFLLKPFNISGQLINIPGRCGGKNVIPLDNNIWSEVSSMLERLITWGSWMQLFDSFSRPKCCWSSICNGFRLHLFLKKEVIWQVVQHTYPVCSDTCQVRYSASLPWPVCYSWISPVWPFLWYMGIWVSCRRCPLSYTHTGCEKE